MYIVLVVVTLPAQKPLAFCAGAFGQLAHLGTSAVLQTHGWTVVSGPSVLMIRNVLDFILPKMLQIAIHMTFT